MVRYINSCYCVHYRNLLAARRGFWSTSVINRVWTANRLIQESEFNLPAEDETRPSSQESTLTASVFLGFWTNMWDSSSVLCRYHHVVCLWREATATPPGDTETQRDASKSGDTSYPQAQKKYRGHTRTCISEKWKPLDRLCSWLTLLQSLTSSRRSGLFYYGWVGINKPAPHTNFHNKLWQDNPARLFC